MLERLVLVCEDSFHSYEARNEYDHVAGDVQDYSIFFPKTLAPISLFRTLEL